MIEPPYDGLDLLDRALQNTHMEAEVMLVGGAVLTIPFHYHPPTRRPGAILADPERLKALVGSISSDAGLPADWLPAAARAIVGSVGLGAGGWEGARLRLFAPLPEYVLAMKCAQLGVADGPEGLRAIEADLRYLMRLMELHTVEAALEAVQVFFTPHQLRKDLPERLARLLE